METQILQIIPAHDKQTCVQIEDQRFTLIAWALIAVPGKPNEIVPVILFDDQPWPVTVQGDWKVRLCSDIPLKLTPVPVQSEPPEDVDTFLRRTGHGAYLDRMGRVLHG